MGRMRGTEGRPEDEKKVPQEQRWKERKIDAFFGRRKRDRSVEGGSETPTKKLRQLTSKEGKEGKRSPKAPKRRPRKELNCRDISSFFTKLPTKPSSEEGGGGPRDGGSADNTADSPTQILHRPSLFRNPSINKQISTSKVSTVSNNINIDITERGLGGNLDEDEEHDTKVPSGKVDKYREAVCGATEYSEPEHDVGCSEAGMDASSCVQTCEQSMMEPCVVDDPECSVYCEAVSGTVMMYRRPGVDASKVAQIGEQTMTEPGGEVLEGSVELYCGAGPDARSVDDIMSRDEMYCGAVCGTSTDVPDNIEVLRDNSYNNCVVLCGLGEVADGKHETRDDLYDDDQDDELGEERRQIVTEGLGLVEGGTELKRLGDDNSSDSCLSTTFGGKEGTQEVGVYDQSGIHTEDTMKLRPSRLGGGEDRKSGQF